MKRRSLLLLPVAALAQSHERRLRGRWAAQMGVRQFSGTWVAEPAANPTDAGGLWQVIGEHSDPADNGDWSARKRESAWDGAWWCKPSNAPTQSGQWTAKTELAATLPLAELLASANKAPLTGAWTSDQGRRGTWTIWLDGDARAETLSESR